MKSRQHHRQPSLVCCVGFTTLWIVASAAHARPVEDWPYDKLTVNADLIVIASPISTTDVENDENLDPDFLVQRITRFAVVATLKGSEVKELELLHFRAKRSAELQQEGRLIGLVNGPCYVTFELPIEDADAESSPAIWLLFLKLRKDGKLEPVSGRSDPQFSVQRLE